jgi:hypothetical protein
MLVTQAGKQSEGRLAEDMLDKAPQWDRRFG